MKIFSERREVSLSQTKTECSQLEAQARGENVNVLMKQFLINNAKRNAEETLNRVDEYYQNHKVLAWIFKKIDKLPGLHRYEKLSRQLNGLQNTLAELRNEVYFSYTPSEDLKEKIKEAVENPETTEIDINALYEELLPSGTFFCPQREFLKTLGLNENIPERKKTYDDIKSPVFISFNTIESKPYLTLHLQLIGNAPESKPIELNIIEMSNGVKNKGSKWAYAQFGGTLKYPPDSKTPLLSQPIKNYEIDRLKEILASTDPHYKLANLD